MIIKRLLISLAILTATGCDGSQSGAFVVTRRQSIPISSCGRIELLFGQLNPARENGPEKLLLAFVAYSPEREFDKITESGGEGFLVSAVNVHFHSSHSPTFGYGAAWNRKSDSVAIDNKEFVRGKGNVFVIEGVRDDAIKVVQLEGMLGLDSSDDCVRAIQAKLEEDSTLPRIIAAMSTPIEESNP